MGYEVEIKQNGAEFEIKGDDVAGIIEIARSLGLTVEDEESKEPEGPVELTINDAHELKVGDRVKSLMAGVGGFPKSWPEAGMMGEIEAIDEDGHGFDVSNAGGDVRWFTSGEMERQFVKVV